MLTNPQDHLDRPVRRQTLAPTPGRRRLDSAPLRPVMPSEAGSTRSLLLDVQTMADRVSGEQASEDLFALSMLAHSSAGLSGHIVTVGTGQGRAAAVLGQSARSTGRSRVFAIDLFPDGDEAPDDVAWSLDAFLKTMTECDLLEHVLPHHGTAATFSQLMPADFRARLILLESAHACTNVATDIFMLEQFLVQGGWLCIDSAFSSFPGATSALETLFRQRNHFDLARHLTPGLFVARKRPM